MHTKIEAHINMLHIVASSCLAITTLASIQIKGQCIISSHQNAPVNYNDLYDFSHAVGELALRQRAKQLRVDEDGARVMKRPH